MDLSLLEVIVVFGRNVTNIRLLFAEYRNKFLLLQLSQLDKLRKKQWIIPFWQMELVVVVVVVVTLVSQVVFCISDILLDASSIDFFLYLYQ